MSKKLENNTLSSKQKRPKSKIATELPISDFLGPNSIDTAITAFITFLEQSSINEKARIETELKKLETEIELRKLDIKEKELENEAAKTNLVNIKGYDVRNKLFSFCMLFAVISLSVLLKHFDILEKTELKIIVVMALAWSLNGNTNFLRSLFSRNRNA